MISIVDDDDLFRGAIEKLVKSLGLRARAFASAESYLQSSWVKETQCLIADVQLPNMGGLELQERLFQLGGFYQLPGDAGSTGDLPDAALQNVANAKFATNLFRVDEPGFVGK